MKKNITDHKIYTEKKLDYERERLLNLIDSRLRRKERDVAMGLAEELFRTEIAFALLMKTRRVRKYNRLLLRIIVALGIILFMCTTFMVLNIRPSFSLIIQSSAALGIVAAIFIDSLLNKRFEKALAIIDDVCETGKQSFIERVLTCGMKCGDSEEWRRLCSLTMIK